MSESPLHVVLGSGPLGLAVVRELLTCGKSVRLVNRSGQSSQTGIEVFRADLSNPEQAKQACKGAAVVYICVQPAYQRWVQEFPGLLATIIDAAASASAHLVMGDNLYMVGEVNGPIHENLPNAAQTRKGKTRARMSDMLFSAHQSGKVPVAIGRGADFFGPNVRQSTMGERTLLPAVLGKTAELLGNANLPHTFTYISDFGKALVILGEQDKALGQVWHVPNAPAVTQRQFIQIAADILGHPIKTSVMGKTMLSFGGLFVPEARETIEMMYQFEKPFIVDSRKFEQTFGMTATPLKESIAETLVWYQDFARQKKD